MSNTNWFKKHKYHLIIAALVLFILLLLAGSKEQPGISYAPENTYTQEQKEAPKAPFEAITLSGDGAKLTDPFHLNEGGYKVTSHYVGDDLFTVYLINSEGEEGPLLANEIGNADVSDVFKAKGGEYRFKVKGDGPWTIKIEAL